MEMKSFTTHRGRIALLDRGNIDTDQIIPKQFLKSIKKTGYGRSLFYDWRYIHGKEDNPDFELNKTEYQGSSILVTGNNFGCGSSREHAVWAVAQYGFKVVIAPRLDVAGDVIPAFADIFRSNSVKNGLLTIELDATQVDQIKAALKAQPALEASVDLEAGTIVLHADSGDTKISFDYDASAKERLLKGLDDIGLTLEHADTIDAFETRHNAQMFRS
jgi:3-isopropylmalate/(R)-2-methylmalate dehydratase small subunit